MVWCTPDLCVACESGDLEGVSSILEVFLEAGSLQRQLGECEEDDAMLTSSLVQESVDGAGETFWSCILQGGPESTCEFLYIVDILFTPHDELKEAPIYFAAQDCENEICKTLLSLLILATYLRMPKPKDSLNQRKRTFMQWLRIVKYLPGVGKPHEADHEHVTQYDRWLQCAGEDFDTTWALTSERFSMESLICYAFGSSSPFCRFLCRPGFLTGSFLPVFAEAVPDPSLKRFSPSWRSGPLRSTRQKANRDRNRRTTHRNNRKKAPQPAQNEAASIASYLKPAPFYSPEGTQQAGIVAGKSGDNFRQSCHTFDHGDSGKLLHREHQSTEDLASGNYASVSNEKMKPNCQEGEEAPAEPPTGKRISSSDVDEPLHKKSPNPAGGTKPEGQKVGIGGAENRDRCVQNTDEETSLTEQTETNEGEKSYDKSTVAATLGHTGNAVIEHKADSDVEEDEGSEDWDVLSNPSVEEEWSEVKAEEYICD